MNYSIYSLDTGEIVKTISCPEAQIQYQYDSALFGCLNGEYKDTHHYVSNGEPVLFPDKPSEHCSFNFISKQWEDTRTVESLWLSIRRLRDTFLISTDWRVTKSIETGVPLTQSWLDYRQSLRDITNQLDPLNIVWPVEPTV